MRKSLMFLGAFALFSTFARADSFDFSITGSGYSTTGVITANPTGTPGVDAITGISGELNNVSITGVATGTPSPSGPFEYVNYFSVGKNNYGPEFDNLLDTNGPSLDEYGVAFTLADGSLDNLYTYGGVTYLLTAQNYTAADVNNPLPGSPAMTSAFTTAVTPEPASFALLGTGLLGVAGVIRRRLA